jgi:LytS/YehU family sensor histidine kinase
MKLSEMMRYMLYDSNASQIELEREIQFINNYLELQRLKKDETMQISFEVSGVKGRHKITPLLLIAFFENCFKHGDIETNPKGWIKAELTLNDTLMQLVVSNSRKRGLLPGDKASGVGLDNVRKRLSILYEGKHQLEILDENNQYKVNLTLILDI